MKNISNLESETLLMKQRVYEKHKVDPMVLTMLSRENNTKIFCYLNFRMHVRQGLELKFD